MKHRQPWLVLGLIIAGVFAFLLGGGRFLQLILPGNEAHLPAITVLPNQIDGWWAGATEQLATREYHYSRVADRQFQAPNRAHAFRTFVAESGLTIAGRENADWSATLSWQPRALSVAANTVSLVQGDDHLVMHNDPLGLKQRWSVADASALSWDLTLDGAVAQLSADNQELALLSPAGETLLLIDLLNVTALGQMLPAHFVLEGTVLTITTAASGPVVAELNLQKAAAPDGLDVTPAWVDQSVNDGDLLGVSLNMAGDVDNNGYMDVIVGVPFYDTGVVDAGAVFIYHNSASGLPITPTMIISGSEVSGLLGSSVAAAGNVNGDAYDDIVIGAPDEKDLTGLNRVGAAYVYLGSAAGISTTTVTRWLGNDPSDAFGFSVAGAGDVDNDGFDDVIVGSPGSSLNHAGEGSVHLFRGSISGTAATADWSFHCGQRGCDLGMSVSPAGNVNGDDYDDFVVGAIRYDSNHVYPAGNYDEGAALVFHGALSGPGAAPDLVLLPGVVDSQTGFSVAGVGDVNGDGFDDVGVGAPGTMVVGAMVYVYHGSNSSLGGTPSWSASGTLTSTSLGFAMAPAGDIDGDGFDDLIIGDNQINGAQQPGAAFVYRGTPFSLEDEPAWLVTGEGVGFWFGGAVAGAADINNDGFDDVLVGSPHWGTNAYPPPAPHALAAPGDDRGAVYLYLGGPVDPITGLVLTHTLPTWLDVPITFDAIISTGQSVTYTWDLGDGTQFTGYSSTVGHTYTTRGWYTVTVTATNPVSVMSDTVVLSVTKTYWSYLPVVTRP